MRYQNIQTASGVMPLSIPNTVTDCGRFYVSYNDYDIGIYGCDTTALVLGQMEKFYILKGDHRSQYAALQDQGFAACLDYYKQHLDVAHKFSDNLPD